MIKDRVGSFMDAVLAIIVTVLVLNLKQPAELTFKGFWDIKESIFAYSISFFYVGIIWVMQLTGWPRFQRVDRKCLLWVLAILFFCSLFPYTTAIVADHTYDLPSEALYGLIALAITLCNMGLTRAINNANGEKVFGLMYSLPTRVVIIDLATKVIGFVLGILVWPPAIIYSMLVNILFRLGYLIYKKD